MFWKRKKVMSDLIGIGDTVQFELRLAEAIAWCNSHANASDPKDSLRNNSLQPNWLDGSRSNIINSVVTLRSSYLSQQKLHPVRSVSDLKGGKLLVYFPDAELADGAAEDASKGFFDVHNLPAWDTWVGLFQNAGPLDVSYGIYLVAYVPSALVALVNYGIEVNPEECITWLTDSDTTLRNELIERRILV
jgi:hypothetical protein